MPTRHEICRAADFPPGDRRIVDIPTLPHSVGVFNVDGAYYALANLCPHQLAPLCNGAITGEMISDTPGEFEFVRDGEVIQCPWHGWKFNIHDGTSVFNPHEVRTRSYEVAVESQTTHDVRQREKFGTGLKGDEPPVDTYDVTVEEDIVVLYV